MYFAGITLSLIASLYIMDRYVKKQLQRDKERAQFEEEETKKLEEEVKEEYLKLKQSKKEETDKKKD